MVNKKPIAAGKSSFGLIDANQLFSELGLKKDSTFLDLACGAGAYSIAASNHIGQAGGIYAVDLWKEGIESLKKEISSRKINNIYTSITDVSKTIPVESHSIDVCLMATVLHDLIQDKTDQDTLREVKRVVKSQGILAIIEFHKIEGPPGPPIGIRLSPEEVEKILFPYSFHIFKTMDLGPYNYLSVFYK